MGQHCLIIYLIFKSNGSSKGLDIHHSNGNIVAQLIHGGSGDEGQLKLYDSNSGTVIISGENNIASLDKFRKRRNWNVTSPDAKLEVYGNVQSDTISIANSAAYIQEEQMIGIAIGFNQPNSSIWYLDSI